jgi:hypothetical protein
MVYNQDPSSYYQPPVMPHQPSSAPVANTAWTQQGRDTGTSNKLKRMREDPHAQSLSNNSGLFRSGKPKEIKRDQPRDPRALRQQSSHASTGVTIPNDIRAQMNLLLNQLLSDLGQTNSTLSLEDLYHENINLYQQLQAQAENIVNARNFSNNSNYPNSAAAAADDSSVQSSSFAYAHAGLSVDPSFNGEGYNQQHVLGFINETPVAIPRTRVEQLIESLPSDMNAAHFSSRALTICQQLSMTLREHLHRSHQQPSSLPFIVNGALPMQATARFIQRVTPHQKVSIRQLLEMPVFRYSHPPSISSSHYPEPPPVHLVL